MSCIPCPDLLLVPTIDFRVAEENKSTKIAQDLGLPTRRNGRGISRYMLSRCNKVGEPKDKQYVDLFFSEALKT
jgi:hypothetical protein